MSGSRRWFLETKSWIWCLPLIATLCTLSSALVIDDSHWNTHPLQLSDGWNMLRPDQTEAIDLFQVELMRPLLPMFFNRSTSWTQKKDANFTLRFTGSAITVVGAKGPSAGGYAVFLDGTPVAGTFDATAEQFVANQTLFARQGLSDAVEHSVVVVNTGGGFLYFDYANVTNATVEGMQSSSFSVVATSVVKPPVATPIALGGSGQLTPAALARLSAPYDFKWNGGVYFVIVFAAIMSLLLIGLVLKHIHQNSKARSDAHRSFFSGGPSKQTRQPAKASKLDSLKRFRKSRISPPHVEAAESSPTDVQRPFDQASSVDLLTWSGPPPRLRPRDMEDDDVSSNKSGRRGNQMTLAEALKQDRAFPPVTGATRAPATRDMF